MPNHGDRGLPSFQPGSRSIDHRDLNRVVEGLEALYRSRIVNGAVSEFGILTSDNPEGVFWVEVTDYDATTAGIPHAWKQVIEDGGEDLTLEDKDYSFSGTTTLMPLYDINGRVIPIGSVVPAWKGYGHYYITNGAICDCFVAQITDQSGTAYSWQEVIQTSNGAWTVPSWGRSGTYGSNPAYEMNLNEGVPDNAYVLMCPGYVNSGNQEYYFVYHQGEFNSPVTYNDTVTYNNTSVVTYAGPTVNYDTNTTINYDGPTINVTDNTTIDIDVGITYVIQGDTYNISVDVLNIDVDNVYVSNTSWTWNSTSTIVYAGPTVNVTNSTAYNITSGQTLTYQGAGSTIAFNVPTVNIGAGSTWTFGGDDFIFSGRLNVCSEWWWCYKTATALTTDEIDWNPGFDKPIVRVPINAPLVLRSMVPPNASRSTIVTLINTGTDTATISHDDASGGSDYRFSCPDGADLDWKPNQGVTLLYDVAASPKVWVPLGIGGSGGSDSKEVKASSDDTTEGYLEDKIVAGTGISISTLNDGSNETVEISATGGSGTVTSVDVVTDMGTAWLSSSGGPVTSSGSITLSTITQTANTVLAGPDSGSAAQPTFRALVADDLPDLSGTYEAVDSTILRWSAAPSSSTDTGSAGQIAYDGTDFYVCTGTNTWAKVGISSAW